MRRAALAAVLVGVAGCGGGSGDASSSTTASTPSAGSPSTAGSTAAPSRTTGGPAPTATPPRPRKRAISNGGASPEQGPGGAGDEQAPRVPATFTLSHGRLTPPAISVPAFFRVQLTVTNQDPKPHRLELRGTGVHVVVPLGAGIRTTRFVAGLRKGTFTLRIDGRRAGTLVSGLQPGP